MDRYAWHAWAGFTPRATGLPVPLVASAFRRKHREPDGTVRAWTEMESPMPHASISSRTVLLHVLTVALASAALCGAGAQTAPARPSIVGTESVHVAARGESWGTIGAREGVTPSVLAARNRRTLASPLKAGDVLAIDNRHIVPVADLAPEGNVLLVNVPQRLLFLFADGRLQARYPVAVGGRNWHTPLGDFAIVLREEDPTWDVPVSIQGRCGGRASAC
jgi:hypothetical protein